MLRAPQTARRASATIEESMSTRAYLGSPTLTQQGSVPREASGFADVADNAVVEGSRAGAGAASPVDSAAWTSGC